MAQLEAFGMSFDTDNITDAHKVIIGVVLAIAILGGGGYQMVYPKWTQWQELKTQIEEQEGEISKLEVQVKNLAALKKELTVIEARLVELRRKIPTDSNVAPLLLDIEEITENDALYGNSGVLNEFRPGSLIDFQLPGELSDVGESAAAKQIKQLPVQVNISRMSYDDLIKLFQDYESYERTLALGNVQITPQEDENELFTPVTSSFTIKAFLLAGES